MDANQKRKVFVIFCFSVAMATIFYIFVVKLNRTPEEIQLAKSVTVQMGNGSLITLNGYSLYDTDKEFKMSDSVYVEINKKHEPSCLRHCTDVYIENGRTYGVTSYGGRYLAILLPGKVVKIEN